MSDVDSFLQQPIERRAESRRACLLRGDVVIGGGRAEPVAVLDLTAFGARVAMRRTLLLPTRLLLRLTLIDSVVIYDAELLWRRGLDAGLNISGRREISGRAH
ncbi:hypothetical protein [Caulobacter henricii]|uniref:Pilus assembly protein PilZ n=1 Tax=Caulobacter henricii TaxID=69395 RepID=A0A0P0NYN3_9CAUL|nr:hypothetical protein [Caulobacter henricii]ALL13219.1 hypothetical protein AQ619_07545 [Caulobacter henricii]